ncbi:peptide ABC transporter substrate-binding protein [Comamonas sp. JC664]|uniref:peptide ABC transporter substrate-binding protein n=1 Tax=Comamonas sp. JC664 TaxID=2801917 RepID=UPI00174B2F80|nr:peptide ABC transporter substrate-binding protein [Comamonas sp. JC664]MBL0696859.1 hypothetical protein [Comamonas sp. JC664]GHG81147.1 hypothetical protein GCM10012319_34160 [Comamonas sp. KCTC 72670]
MRLRSTLACVALLASASAQAAGRPRYGGELRVAHGGPPEIGEPALADTPLEATLLGLLTRPVCQDTRDEGAVPALARQLSRPTAQALQLTLPSATSAQGLARAWMRLASNEGASPYRALLHAVRGEARQLTPRGAVLELPLSYPWPDLERALCHPALAPPVSATPVGPFTAAGRGALEAQLAWPQGRPYLDRLQLTATDQRGLSRLWSSRQVQVELGVASETDSVAGTALYATFLAFSPRRLPADFRQAVESAIDREDLTRLFVQAPAQPMPHLLPPALLDAPGRPRPAAPPATPSRTVTLLYDASVEDQRAVAERIQVKLHDRGYTVALEALSRAALRARWAKGDFELMLHALLLPPVPGPALAVVLEAGGRRDLLGVELPAIGALPAATARDARARERALALAGSVPLVPLYAQGLGMRFAPDVGGVMMDAQGLPSLDGLYVLPAEGAALGGRP